MQYTYIEVIITAEFMENKQILICPDSFKGTLTAEEVADTIEKAIKDVSPAANTRVLPIADGGEGTLECFRRELSGRGRFHIPSGMQHTFYPSCFQRNAGIHCR